MENIQNDIDNIPEGFEFRDEYMIQGFEIYEKMKNDQKRKKRLIIFFLGFSLSSILALFYVSFNSNDSSRNTFISKTKEPTTQQLTNEKNLISKNKDTENINLFNSTNQSRIEQQISNKSITSIENSSINYREINKNSSKIQPITNYKTNINSTLTENNTISIPEEIAIVEIPEHVQNIENLDTIKPSDSLKKTPFQNDLLTHDDKPNKASIYDFTDEYVKNQFYLTAGLNTKYNYSSTSKSSISDYTFSGGYNRNFQNGLSFGSSIEYFSVSNMNSKVEITDIIYEYRASYKTTEIRTKSLQYIAFNPEIGYKINKRHYLSTGFGFEFLLSGKNEITVTESIKGNPAVTTITQDKNYISGFKACNQSLFIGYNFSLNRNFSIGCKYNFGLTDITDNSIFTNTHFDRNNRIVFNLKMKLN